MTAQGRRKSRHNQCAAPYLSPLGPLPPAIPSVPQYIPPGTAIVIPIDDTAIVLPPEGGDVPWPCQLAPLSALLPAGWIH